MPFPQQLTLAIVTPDRAIVHAMVDEAQIPGAEGYLGVLPGHTPLLVSLQVGEFWYRQGEDTTHLHVAFGFAEILPDRIRILARTAERGDEIDIERAQSAAARARKRLAGAPEVDFQRARIALVKSLARLQVAKRMRRRRAPVR